ncbi:MAG: DUF3298 domain-containing protein [Janthinobacterium lividum]
MSFSTRSWRWLVALGALAGCQSPSGQSTATATPPPAANPAAPTAAAAPAASSPGTAYWVFRGLLPGQADSVTLHLVTSPKEFFAYGTGPGHHGSYYGANGHPYELQGQPSTPDSLVLNDISLENDRPYLGTGATWRLKQQPNGSLAGTVSGHATRLRLVPAAAGSVSFAVRYFADSLAALPRDTKSPKARFSLQALAPTGGLPALREALTANILRDLRGDTAAAEMPPLLPTLQKQQRDSFFKNYRADAADLPAPTDTADLGSYRASLNYASQSASYVLFQQGDLVSLAYFTYKFIGGAHGNYGTVGASYDLRTGRRLRYHDIFRPTAAAQLPALLAVAVRPLVGLGPREPLDKALFVKKMPITRNVFLTTGGVEFIYQPYEIASYSQGEVRVFLPLGQVRALLQESLPGVPSVPGVAATR